MSQGGRLKLAPSVAGVSWVVQFGPRAFEGTGRGVLCSIEGGRRTPANCPMPWRGELSLDGTGQLLQCGLRTLPLTSPGARLFEQVVALDPEIGMLQAGQQRYTQAGVVNVPLDSRRSRGHRHASDVRLVSRRYLRAVVSPVGRVAGPSLISSCRVALWS